MNNLSENSMIKVFSCLKQNNNTVSIDYLKKTCPRFLQIANENQFNKIDAAEIRIHLYEISRDPVIKRLVVMASTKHRTEESRSVFSSYLDSNYMYSEEGRSYGNNNTLILRKDIAAINTDSINETAHVFLTRIVSKVNKVKLFSIFGCELNIKLVKSLTSIQGSIKCATILNIQNCTIDLSISEMSDLLGIFEQLRSICVAGKFMKECLFDKHLFGISDHITICNGRDISGIMSLREVTPVNMHGLTSQLCQHWMNKPPKSVTFLNISTKIAFNAAWKLFSSFSKRNHDSSTTHDGIYKFAEIDIEPSFVQELAVVQQNRKYMWSIKEELKRKNKYKIDSLSFSSSFEFSVVLPYVKPDFAMFLEKLARTKTTLETATTLTSADEESIQMHLSAIELQLHEYEHRYKLSDPQIDLTVIQQRERRRIDQERVVGGIENLYVMAMRMDDFAERAGLFDELLYMRNILLLMGEDAQVAESIRNTLNDINRIEAVVQLRMSQAIPEEPEELKLNND